MPVLLKPVHMQLDTQKCFQPLLLKLCQLWHPGKLEVILICQTFCGFRDSLAGARLFATIHLVLSVALCKECAVNFQVHLFACLPRGMRNLVGLPRDDSSHLPSSTQALQANLQDDFLFCSEHNFPTRCRRFRCQCMLVEDDGKYSQRADVLQDHGIPTLGAMAWLGCSGRSYAIHEIKVRGRPQKRCPPVRAVAMQSFRESVSATSEERQDMVERLKSLPLELMDEHIWPRVHELGLMETLEQVRRAGQSEFEDLPDLMWEGDVMKHNEMEGGMAGSPGYSRRVTEALTRLKFNKPVCLPFSMAGA